SLHPENERSKRVVDMADNRTGASSGMRLAIANDPVGSLNAHNNRVALKRAPNPHRHRFPFGQLVGNWYSVNARDFHVVSCFSKHVLLTILEGRSPRIRASWVSTAIKPMAYSASSVMPARWGVSNTRG